MPRITTFLTFNNQAEDAARLYTSVFPNSKIRNVNRFPEGVPGIPAGTVMTVSFELDGAPFVALNGGPSFRFAEGISLYVDCENQKEVDHYWDRLTDGGAEQPCGWLKDRFGVSWQIIPRALTELLSDPDRARSQRVMNAMLQMKKIDIAALRRAHGGQ
jgi:predicted 3-demethylubiquinone-9 3-methyltransferase (glyoxalase superfamily)